MRSEQGRQTHDAMLTTIFKAVHEDSMPESHMGIYSTDRRTEWDVTLHVTLSSDHSQSMSKMASCVLTSCRPCGQGIGSQPTSVCVPLPTHGSHHESYGV